MHLDKHLARRSRGLLGPCGLKSRSGLCNRVKRGRAGPWEVSHLHPPTPVHPESGGLACRRQMLVGVVLPCLQMKPLVHAAIRVVIAGSVVGDCERHFGGMSKNDWTPNISGQ